MSVSGGGCKLTCAQTKWDDKICVQMYDGPPAHPLVQGEGLMAAAVLAEKLQGRRRDHPQGLWRHDEIVSAKSDIG